MKKLLFILLTAIFLSQTTQAQNCTCDPNGWQSGTASINKLTKPIKCGYQFSVTCTDNIIIREEFKCTGNCVPKYNAILKNTATGAVVASYPTFTFPWSYHFTAAGNYSLEIQPVCGTTKCTVCTFFFTVTCANPTVCDCDPNGWKPFTATIGTVSQTVNCGHQFAVGKYQPFKLTGQYVCKGTCTARYEAVLKNMTTNTVIFDNTRFAFPWNYTFTIAGSYSLQLIPMCGDKKCAPCNFYFTAK